ncbi:hypothetical protein [Brazilian marseillevirus]|uniref:hypothetical protein n=1 Tax=Brazilian marseillevirus TaxID=1813599 RepID=UPI0007855A62|nr:hypothetical protein A3303_gp242 [Brazilian marseillevirus]AMQ10750.1 hypothetical protein [Brazilian marseillevirus]
MNCILTKNTGKGRNDFLLDLHTYSWIKQSNHSEEMSVVMEKLLESDRRENAQRRQNHAATKDELYDSLVDYLRVSEENLPQLKVFDETDGLVLVHYVDEPPHKSLEKYRGLILEYNESQEWGEPEYREICRSFPFTPDFVGELPIDKKVVSAHWSEEGTVLRVFWYGERWYISSHRLIDCTQRKWSSKRNFGELFDDCIPRSNLSSVLNKEYVYVFLLQHPENRIVTLFDKPRLLHVQTLRSDGEVLVPVTDHVIEHQNVTIPEPIEELSDFVEKAQNPPNKKNGILIAFEDGSYAKVVSKEYTRLRNIRGNNPDISQRYLNLQKYQEKEANELLEMFPEKKTEMLSVAEDVKNLESYLYSLYRQRYIHKERATLPRDEHNIIKFTREAVSSQVGGRFSQYSFSDLAEITRKELVRQLAISKPVRIMRLVENMNNALAQ